MAKVLTSVPRVTNPVLTISWRSCETLVVVTRLAASARDAAAAGTPGASHPTGVSSSLLAVETLVVVTSTTQLGR